MEIQQNFNAFRFVENLKYMGIGMLGIFMIIGIIIAATYAVGFFTSKRSKKDDI